jgi:hypothetical protein
MSFSYSSGVITQTGTDTDLSGLAGLTGVTVTSYSSRYEIYDIGTNRLDIEGDLTINPENNMLISNAPTATIPDMSVNVRANATLTLGVKTTVGSAVKYTTGTAMILTEPGSLNNDGSLHVESGGTLEAFGATIQLAGPTRVRNGAYFTCEDLTLVNCRGSNTQFRIEANNSTDTAKVSVTANGMTLNGDASNDSCRLTTLGKSAFPSNAFVFNFVRAQYQPAANGYPPQVFLNFDNGNNVDSADFAYAGSGDGGTNINFNGNLVDFRNVARRLRYTNANAKGGFCKTTKNVNFVLQNASGTGLSTVSYYAVDVDSGNRINFNSFDSTADIVYSGQNAGPTLTITATVEFMAGQGTTRFIDSRTNADDTILFRFISYTTNITSTSPVLIGLGDLNPVVVNATDSLVTETTKATVDAYATIDNAQELYDRTKSYLVDNFTGESSTIITRVGNQVVLVDKNLIIDSTAGSAFSYSDPTITINSSTFTGGATATTGLVTVQNGALLSGGAFDCDISYDSGASTTLTNVTCNGAIDFTTAGTYTLDGCNINEVTNSSGGVVTLILTNGASVGTNTGPNITINNPVTISITVTDTDNVAIQNARVRVTATETVGTITDGDVIVEGLTNASGVVETTSFNYESAFDPSGLNIQIKARQASVSPYKKPFQGAGTITSFGFSTTVALLEDE